MAIASCSTYCTTLTKLIIRNAKNCEFLCWRFFAEYCLGRPLAVDSNQKKKRKKDITHECYTIFSKYLNEAQKIIFPSLVIRVILMCGFYIQKKGS